MIVHRTLRLLVGVLLLFAAARTAAAGAFDVVFVGSGFDATEQLELTNLATRSWNYLLTQEPFKSRQADLRWWIQEGTFDLKTRYNGRLLTATDLAPAKLAFMTTGRHYDKIVVLVDSGTYGGSGGSIAVSYNGSLTPRVVIHELAHAGFGLRDEYNLYSVAGPVSTTTFVNCFAGVPPNPAWGFLALTSYFRGCGYPNWYRSSSSSLMKDLNAQYFNDVSRRQINAKLDWYKANTL